MSDAPERGIVFVDQAARSVGLATLGHPELEVRAPMHLREEAALLVGLLADRVAAGERIAQGGAFALTVCDAVRVEVDARAVGAKGNLCVVVDRGAGGLPSLASAKVALGAMAVVRARAARQAGDGARARAILDAMVDWFPDADADDRAPRSFDRRAQRYVVNERNCLVHFERANAGDEPAERDGFFARALDRSTALAAMELGGDHVSLPFDELRADVGAIVAALHADAAPAVTPIGAAGAVGMGFLLSPALRVEGELRQGVAIGLPTIREYFFEGRVAQIVRREGILDLVAAAVAGGGDDPRALLRASRETVRDLYGGGFRFDDDAPSRPFVFESRFGTTAHVPLVTRVLAGIGRDLAAGLTLDECAARWVDGATSAAIEDKLDALRIREEEGCAQMLATTNSHVRLGGGAESSSGRL